MKTIVAFIKPHKLDDVMLALHKINGLTGASASEVHGFGRDRNLGDQEMSLDMKPHIRIEIACSVSLVEQVVGTLKKAAHTGLRGDGKIYVSSVEQAVRISTGEDGEAAI